MQLADADQMIAAAGDAGRVLSVFQSLRYAPDVVKVRKVVASGCLGRILSVHVRHHGFARRWDWQTL